MSKVDVKVVLLGKHSVGKTCLVERYLHGKFKDTTVATVGAAFGAKKVTVGNHSNAKEITLGIWDTAGQERYESMSRIYYRSARATIVCFDLTDGKSFEKVKFWVDELRGNEEGCEIYVVGTKLDSIQENGSVRATNKEEVNDYAKSIGAHVFETSSKTGEGIEELFNAIAASYARQLDAPSSTRSNTVSPDKSNNGNPPPKKCCG